MRARTLDGELPVRLAAAIPLLLTAGVLAASSLGGCASTETVAATPESPAATEVAAGGPSTPDPDPRAATTADGGVDAEALGALAARDMEELRALRQAAESAPPAGEPGGVPDSGRVRWNSPERARRAADPPAAAAAPSADVARTDPAAAERAALGPPPAPPAAPAETAVESDPLSLDEITMLLVRLRQQLYRASIDSDQPLRELMAIAAMSLVDPGLSLPDSASRELTGDELEILESFHAFFRVLGEGLDGSTVADETILAAVDDLRDAIDRGPELQLPTSALCWRIGGFGDYDAFTRNAFLAHSQRQVILYLEIEGFVSEQNAKGQWVTETSQQLEIYSESDGIPVWSEPWQKAVDVANKQRRDFFTSQVITIPPALSVGAYRLKIRVRDERSGAETEQSIPFEMVADEKLAAKVGAP